MSIYQDIEYLDPYFNPESSILNQFTQILKNDKPRLYSKLSKKKKPKLDNLIIKKN